MKLVFRFASASRSLLALALALAAVSCGGASRMPALVVGPYDGRSNGDLFAQVLAVIEAEGLEAFQADPMTGFVEVRSRAAARPDRYGRPVGPPALRVQCYQEGWIRIEPGGRGVLRQAGEYVVPAVTGREMRDLALALRRHLEHPGEA